MHETHYGWQMPFGICQPCKIMKNDRNVFYATGEINLRMFDALVEFVQRVPNSEHRIDICINSTGGGVIAAFAIANLLRQLPCKLRTINVGKVDSAAVVLFLCGGERIACPNSRFAFHHVGKPIDSGAYTYLQLKEFAKEVHDMEMQIVDLLCERTGLDLSFWSEQLKQGAVFTPEQAIKCGLATGVNPVD